MPDHSTGRRGRPRKARCLYIVLDPDDPRLQGRAVRAWEEEGLLIFYCARGEVSERLAAEMTARLVTILDGGIFLQCWRDGEAGHWLEVPERYFEFPMWDTAHYKRVRAGLPEGACQFMAVHASGFAWLVFEDDMSQEACAILNALVSMMLAEGLWAVGGDADL